MKTHATSYLTLLAALTILWVIGVRADSLFDSIRVYATEPDFFEYIFTSFVSGSGDAPVLALNHQSGKTFFAQIGDTLGQYKITAFEPHTKKVFNSSINSYLEKQAGKVTLKGPDGQSVVLEQGKRLARTGHVAYVVSLKTGDWRAVRPKNIFSIGSTTAKVNMVTKNSATILVGNAEQSIPIISQEEKEKLVLLWQERQKKIEEKRKLTAQHQKEQQKKKAVVKESAPQYRPYQSIEIRYPAKCFFGTEYRYPPESQVLPSIWTDSGKLIQPSVVIPTRFETRRTGISVRYR